LFSFALTRSRAGGRRAAYTGTIGVYSTRESFIMTTTGELSAEQIAAEFLTFRLGGEQYGIDILKVQEIRACDKVTRIANTPPFIKGVIDLRGVIVPIIDMRVKFNLEEAEYNQFTVVIILHVIHRVVGIVVDSVSDVVNLAPEQIKDVPSFGSSIAANYLSGVATPSSGMTLLLDIERLMSSDEMQILDAVNDGEA
jgi:purine-binding chemotaxis protein CheW